MTKSIQNSTIGNQETQFDKAITDQKAYFKSLNNPSECVSRQFTQIDNKFSMLDDLSNSKEKPKIIKKLENNDDYDPK